MDKGQEIMINRINELCCAKNINYYGLAYRSDVPLTTLLNIMRGHTKNPGIFTIIKICDGLEIPVTEFFDTEDFLKLMINE